ncbi:MAG: DUF2505 domain-containing protein [Knoellia sp.]
MRIERTLDVNVDVDSVHTLMSSPDFQRRKADAVGAVDCEVDVTHDGDRSVVTVHRRVPAGTVPEFIKAMVEPTLGVREVECWGPLLEDGSRCGSFDIDVTGAPIKLRGSVQLLPRDGGCSLIFGGELTTSVPLFRAAIERAASTQVLDTIETEFGLIRSELVDAPGTRADEEVVR